MMKSLVVGDFLDGTLKSCRHEVQERASTTADWKQKKKVRIILAETGKGTIILFGHTSFILQIFPK